MTKLKPWTAPPSPWVTAVITPTTRPAVSTAGPPLVPASAAASVWMIGWFARSCLKPDTAPWVTEACTLADAFSSSWLITTPGKPITESLSPIFSPAGVAEGQRSACRRPPRGAARGRGPTSPRRRAADCTWRSWRRAAGRSAGRPRRRARALTRSAGVAATASRASESSTRGASPGARPRCARTAGRHSARNAFSTRCAVIQRAGGSWATNTTWALVTTQPRGLTRKPDAALAVGRRRRRSCRRRRSAA